ncbi:hypothetical protein DSO57_1002223 [Entomophthora muscae]|uniref:Uncharacterized protein n=1 Tax=Entomophthora muscae TaxID=34485 RepID=A0ACC2U832_9FUNG|nr:hypothetical protein DSO57_1002223 [Entomophthora muscae]
MVFNNNNNNNIFDSASEQVSIKHTQDTHILTRSRGKYPYPSLLSLCLTPYDPQEKLFDFNYHSGPSSETEKEQEQEPDPGASTDAQIKSWDVKIAHNICNCNVTFAVLATFPASYPIVSKKGSADFVYKGYSFNCTNKEKAIPKHHYKRDFLGCPARFTTHGFTRFKALTIGHDSAETFDPLHQLIY